MKMRYIIAIISLILSPLQSRAEYVELDDLLKQTDSHLEWEPVRNFGRIVKGDFWVSFKLGIPFCLLGNSQKEYTAAILRRNGSIIFPSETAQKITAFFQSEAASESHRIAVILIDPGHGGKDPGAIGQHSNKAKEIVIREKDTVLDVSQRLSDLLKKTYPGKSIQMTRDTDLFLELSERTEMANSIPLQTNEAIIFISIHANAAFSKEPHGFEVWYLPGDYERDLLDQNSIGNHDPEILPILNKMLDAEFSTESIVLAKEILAALAEQVGDLTINRGLKAETWFVVRNSKMPSVLVELGFVSNPEEALLMTTDEYLNKLVLGIYIGVKRFIDRFENTKGFTE